MNGDPFQAEGDSCLVLRNNELQYSLWPAANAVPQGWQVCVGPAPYEECMAYVSTQWTDLRPASLRMAQSLEGPDRR